MNSQEKRILGVTCYGHFLSHFNVLVFPALVLPLASKMQLDMSTILGISFWMYLLFGITALPWGMLADRLSPRLLFILFYIGSGLSAIAAARYIDSPSALTISLAALGLFSSIYHPVGLGLISTEVRQVSLAMGYNGMFGNVGLASAPLVTGLINWIWGPAGAYLILGAMHLLGAVLTLALPITLHSKETDNSARGGNGNLSAFLILLIAMMLGGIAYRGATVVMPAYFELKNQAVTHFFSLMMGRDIPGNLVATFTTSLIFFIGIIGQYVGGRVGNRFDPRMSYLIFHAITVPAAFLMGFFHDIPLLILVFVYTFFLIGMQPIENTLVALFAPKRLHHSAFGMKFVLTFGVGAFSVKMVEFVERGLGIEATFPVLGCVSLLLVVAVLWLIHHTAGKTARV
ncbi:MAG: MFS transporter [Deltaproteobacteria bacterium]